MIFCERMEVYLGDRVRSRENPFNSIVFDLLSVVYRYGLLTEVTNMARLGHFWSKDVWTKMVWKRAWELDECFWRIQVRCHRNLDLMYEVCGGPSYLCWWKIADYNHNLMKCCEMMVRLVSHSSLLKTDDVRLKRSSVASRFCNS